MSESHLGLTVQQKTKINRNELNKFIDMIPCPHCLQFAYLSEAGGNTVHPTDFRCVNERCPNRACYIHLSAYDVEIELIKKRLLDGYSYPKKVIEFVQHFRESVKTK